MIKMIARRIAAGWRLELCLFFGLLVAAAVVSAIPLYVDGVLQDSLQKEFASDNYWNPPIYSIELDPSPWFVKRSLHAKEFLGMMDEIQKCAAGRIVPPLLLRGWNASLADMLELPTEEGSDYLTVKSMTGLEALVTCVEGRYPGAKPPTDGAIEVACLQSTADAYGLVVGRQYKLRSGILGRQDEHDPVGVDLVFRLVGTFVVREDKQNAPGWQLDSGMDDCLFVHPQAFLEQLVAKAQADVNSINLTWVLDYRRIRVPMLAGLIRDINEFERDCDQYRDYISNFDTPIATFRKIAETAHSLRLMLSALALPTLVLIFYYVLQTAGLIVEQRRGEIAMLRSRGASAFQLAMTFVVEWGLLACACLLCGPPLGFFLAQVVGASAGFLNFVDRRALPVSINKEAFFYTFLLCLAMVCAATIPAIRACRHTIVAYKQDQSRKSVKPIWERFFLDLLLLCAGVYGYRVLIMQTRAVGETAAGGTGRLIDPLLFIAPTLCALGGGLAILRVFPWLAALGERVVTRSRSVGWYTSLLEMSRNADRYRPLILLIVLTTSMGIFSSAIARTIDHNTRDRIYYAVGADLKLTEEWHRFKITSAPAGTGGGMPQISMAEDIDHPYEPPFYLHRQAPGVVAAARVQKTEAVEEVSAGGRKRIDTVMAIDPAEFVRAAWFRRDLTPRHPYYYLNVLAKYPQACLVSRGWLDQSGKHLGDTITLMLNRQRIDFVIAGTVDYWPTLYEDQGSFIIVNLNYVTEQSTIAPYEVWLKLAPEAKLARILKYLQSRGVIVREVYAAQQELIKARRDPQKMGLYGLLSIGFLVAVVMTVIGLFLHAFISVRHRMVQFGVLRAIGLSRRQLVVMLGLEQLWSVGLGLAAGTLMGQAIGILFVPFVRTAAAMTETAPPFRVVISSADIAIIYLVLIPMLLAALVGLAVMLFKLQIHQAIKLGEDG
ncbi:MAG: FtsX-like permease family protein [Firmicutes bacterium]|nr:FtsX-like permease family protein [Bacillota bacterium]